jgi:hypothetical protein
MIHKVQRWSRTISAGIAAVFGLDMEDGSIEIDSG